MRTNDHKDGDIYAHHSNFLSRLQRDPLCHMSALDNIHLTWTERFQVLMYLAMGGAVCVLCIVGIALWIVFVQSFG